MPFARCGLACERGVKRRCRQCASARCVRGGMMTVRTRNHARARYAGRALLGGRDTFETADCARTVPRLCPTKAGYGQRMVAATERRGPMISVAAIFARHAAAPAALASLGRRTTRADWTRSGAAASRPTLNRSGCGSARAGGRCRSSGATGRRRLREGAGAGHARVIGRTVVLVKESQRAISDTAAHARSRSKN
jgi:hypothetical protein